MRVQAMRLAELLILILSLLLRVAQHRLKAVLRTCERHSVSLERLTYAESTDFVQSMKSQEMAEAM
jgi:hypothetical protein